MSNDMKSSQSRLGMRLSVGALWNRITFPFEVFSATKMSLSSTSTINQGVLKTLRDGYKAFEGYHNKEVFMKQMSEALKTGKIEELSKGSKKFLTLAEREVIYNFFMAQKTINIMIYSQLKLYNEVFASLVHEKKLFIYKLKRHAKNVFNEKDAKELNEMLTNALTKLEENELTIKRNFMQLRKLIEDAALNRSNLRESVLSMNATFAGSMGREEHQLVFFGKHFQDENSSIFTLEKKFRETLQKLDTDLKRLETAIKHNNAGKSVELIKEDIKGVFAISTKLANEFNQEILECILTEKFILHILFQFERLLPEIIKSSVHDLEKTYGLPLSEGEKLVKETEQALSAYLSVFERKVSVEVGVIADKANKKAA